MKDMTGMVREMIGAEIQDKLGAVIRSSFTKKQLEVAINYLWLVRKRFSRNNRPQQICKYKFALLDYVIFAHGFLQGRIDQIERGIQRKQEGNFWEKRRGGNDLRKRYGRT